MALRADSGCACYRDGTLLHLKVVLRGKISEIEAACGQAGRLTDQLFAPTGGKTTPRTKPGWAACAVSAANCAESATCGSLYKTPTKIQQQAFTRKSCELPPHHIITPQKGRLPNRISCANQRSMRISGIETRPISSLRMPAESRVTAPSQRSMAGRPSAGLKSPQSDSGKSCQSSPRRAAASCCT